MIKEFHESKNLFDEAYTGLTTSLTYLPMYVGDGEFTLSTTTPINDGTSASLFFLRGQASSGASTPTNGVWKEQSRTLTAINGYVTIAYRYNEGVYVNPQNYNTMLNKGSTALPYEPYGDTWNTKSYVKSISGIQTYTKFPIVLRTTEQTIPTWNVKGNMQQSGTPTPTSPITPQECGDMTENYFDIQNYVANITTHNCTVSVAANGVKIIATGSDAYAGEAYKLPDRANAADRAAAIPVTENTTYVLSADVDTFSDCYISYLDSSYDALNANYTKLGVNVPATFTTPADTAYISLRLGSKSLGVGQSKTFANITLTKNGKYKLPIVSGGVTTNVYLNEPLRKIGDYADTIAADGTVTRVIKKIVFDGTENWELQSINTHGIANFHTDYDFLSGISSDRSAINSHFYQTTAPIAEITEPCFSISPTSEALYLKVLSSVASTAEAMKAWLAAQYSTGTPVTIWYVLAIPLPQSTTTSAIPTTSGLNTINVATTLKPSEMSITYDGYKLCKGQRYSRTAQLLDKDNIVDGGAFYPSVTGNRMIASNNTLILLLPCKPNTTYTISRRNVITKRFVMCFLTSNEIYVDMPIYSEAHDDTALTLTSTSTAESQYLCFYYAKSGGSDSSTPAEIQAQLAEVMINEGSTAKPYQPYLDWE